MQPSDRELITGMKETLDKVILPELSSSYAKSRAVLMREMLDDLSSRRPASDAALDDENARLRELLGYVIERLQIVEDSFQRPLLVEIRTAIRERIKTFVAQEELRT